MGPLVGNSYGSPPPNDICPRGWSGGPGLFDPSLGPLVPVDDLEAFPLAPKKLQLREERGRQSGIGATGLGLGIVSDRITFDGLENC